MSAVVKPKLSSKFSRIDEDLNEDESFAVRAKSNKFKDALKQLTWDKDQSSEINEDDETFVRQNSGASSACKHLTSIMSASPRKWQKISNFQKTVLKVHKSHNSEASEVSDSSSVSEEMSEFLRANGPERNLCEAKPRQESKTSESEYRNFD